MPLHVEIRRGLRHAREFNLDLATVRRTVLLPWSRSEVVEFADTRWKPEESKLTVLEGPVLDGPDLAFGQGWNAANRTATDVTERLLAKEETPTVAVLATAADRAPVERLMADAGFGATTWEAVRARILASQDPPADAVVIVLSDELPPLDLGLALGAFGERAVLTQSEDTALANGLPTPIRLDREGVEALAQRLRLSRRS